MGMRSSPWPCLPLPLNLGQGLAPCRWLTAIAPVVLCNMYCALSFNDRNDVLAMDQTSITTHCIRIGADLLPTPRWRSRSEISHVHVEYRTPQRAMGSFLPNSRETTALKHKASNRRSVFKSRLGISVN